LSALSRAERGLGAEVELVDPNEMLQSIFTNYGEQAKAKGLALNIDVPNKLPTIVSSRMYLQEILQNLVVNAIKYTRQGSITLKGRRDSEAIKLEVSDTGIGISKADQKHIFEKFYRSEDYRTRESSGTGLGLYVCKKLAEKIGLRLTFDSRLNHGSTFTVTVPSSQITKPSDLIDAKLQAHPPALAGAATPDSTHSAPSS
jgi:signal transduction histidine kinase